ncbi:hypothetical protein [Roseiflexus sp.]
MSNITINRLDESAQEDSVWHDEDYEARRFTAFDVRPRPFAPRAKDAAYLAAFWLVALGVFWFGGYWSEREFAYNWRTFWHTLLAVTALLPLAAIIAIGVAWWRERNTYIARARLTRDRLQNPIPADLAASLTQKDYLAILERMAALEEAVAPYRVYRGVESVNVHAPNVAQPAAHPASRDESVAVETPDVWLPGVLDEAHLMLAGRTRCGKTTTAEALLAHVIDAGGGVMVIDPHWQPGKWHGVEAIGAGRDYGAIRRALKALEAEMTARYRRLANGEPVGEPATVVIDETPAVAGELAGDWKALATRLGSEARKARIRLILLTQSPLVEDLGVNSVMRRNFTIVGLDMESIRLMLRGADAATRQAILARFEGEPYPALREAQGVFRVLDRRGIDRIAPRAEPRVWRPSVLDDAPDGEHEARRTDGQADVNRLAALIRQGVTREEARLRGAAFSNADWTEAKRRVEEEQAMLHALLAANGAVQAVPEACSGAAGQAGDAPDPRPTYACPRCGRALTAGQYGAAKRRGRCKECKEGG